MGNTNLLSNRSRLANSTRNSRLTLWQKKRWSRLNLNATKQGRVWNMYISVLAFSSFAHRKLKLGQNYKKKEIPTWIVFPLLFVSLVTICCMHMCILACMCVSGHCVWCLEKNPVLGRVHKHSSSVQPHATTKPLPSDAIPTYHPTKFSMQYSRISPFMKPSLYSFLHGTAHALCGNWLLNNWPVWEAVRRQRLLEVNITALWEMIV